MVIIFSHSSVREFLLKNGLVYTYREMHPETADGVRPQIGDDWATDWLFGEKIADVVITPVEPMDFLNIGHVLTRYVRESGFYFGQVRVDDAVSDWARAINSLNTNEPTQGWIYKVEIRE